MQLKNIIRRMGRFAPGSSLLGILLLASSAASAASFVVMTNATMPRPNIVIQYNAVSNTGWDWGVISNSNPDPQWMVNDMSESGFVRSTVLYMQEAIKRMTTNKLTIISSNNLSKGIILTTLAGATIDIRTNSAVLNALTNNGSDKYFNNVEAYYIDSQTNRLLIVANTAKGLAAGTVEALESVNYEVLGMGPNWIYSPPGKTNNLIFTVTTNGRPSTYIRYAIAAQSYAGQGGVSVFLSPQPPAPDEDAEVSFARWWMGSRQTLGGGGAGSMPVNGGQALIAYHGVAFDYIRTNTSATNGFYAKVKRGLFSAMGAPANPGWNLYVCTDGGAPHTNEIYEAIDSSTWTLTDPGAVFESLDLSVSWVRDIIFKDMKIQSETWFSNNPNAYYAFGCETEDGGGESVLPTYMNKTNWYPAYRTAEGQSWGAWLLNGYFGLNQPTELWDPKSASDTVFGYGNWLLREYDKYITSLPLAQRKTSTGFWKTNLMFLGFYAYGDHDVPPNFNIDKRIQVSASSFSKHVGAGKWTALGGSGQLNNVSKAFNILNPTMPGAIYIAGFTQPYFELNTDPWTNKLTNPQLLGPSVSYSAAPAAMAKYWGDLYASGVKSVQLETEFGSGRHGLFFYLVTKKWWNNNLGITELDALRDRWFQRAYATNAWVKAKAYYDFMLPENWPCSAPGIWASAMNKLDVAARAIPLTDTNSINRMDDLKQYWYFYFMVDTGKWKSNNVDFISFEWKGQMGYSIPLYDAFRQAWNYFPSSLDEVMPVAQRTGRAHYTHAEMDLHWRDTTNHWLYKSPQWFTNTTLVDGTAVSNIDLNDLVRVGQFVAGVTNGFLPAGEPYYYNGYADYKQPNFYTSSTNAGAQIGYKMYWYDLPDQGLSSGPLPEFYGADWWNTNTRQWEAVADIGTNYVTSSKVYPNYLGVTQNVCTVSITTTHKGTYRFRPGAAGQPAHITELDFDLVGGTNKNWRGLTQYVLDGQLSQDVAWFYIPKGRTTLDLETWDTASGVLAVNFYSNSLSSAPVLARTTNISVLGTHKITLKPGEAGNLANVEAPGGGFTFPYMYSVPTLFSKHPADVMVPRKVAIADGLTILP